MPKYENEKRKEAEKHHHIVHCSKHDHKLSLKSRKESDKLEYSEQSECSQDGEARALFIHAKQKTVDNLHSSKAGKVRIVISSS